MRGSSTSVRGALLGLLLERPGHGGDIANRVSARLGETWRFDPSDVYRLLDQLEEEGLAVSCEQPRRGNQRRTRVVYYPTEGTSQALVTWMETLLPREPIRLDLQAKLAVARAEDVSRLLTAIREHERECLALASLVSPSDGTVASWSALFIDCTRDAVYAMLQAEVDWAARTRARINDYAAGCA
jgi:DNA-binding PadR family transcriptional regulator